MTVTLIVDSTTVYDTTGGVSSGTGTSTGLSTATSIGRSRFNATASAAGVGVVTGRLFTGYAGFSTGRATVLGAGGSVGGGGSSQHITLFTDSVTVYDAGGGFLYTFAAFGTATASGVGVSRRSGQGQAAGTSVAAARGLAPNQAIASSAGRATVTAGVFRQAIGFAQGLARVGSPLDQLTAPPLSGRSMTTLMQAAIQEVVVRPILIFEGDFRNGTLNLWSGIGTMQWNGKTWTGTGNLLSISPVEETDQQQASGIVVNLTAVPSSQIALALAEVQRNQQGHIWLGLVDANDNIIESPQTLFRGRLDRVSIDDSEDSATIHASYENEMITFEHPREVRYTDQEQKRLYPDDRGLEFVAGLQDKTLRWGSRG